MAGSGSSRIPEKDRSSTSRSRSENCNPARPQILIVEDHLPDLALIREALDEAGLGADVYVARNGDQATEFVDAADAGIGAPCPDLVLLDLNLPKKTGDAILRHIRNSRSCGEVAVLIVTTSNSNEDRRMLSALGATGYFHKPSAYEEFMKLGQIVKDLLAGRR